MTIEDYKQRLDALQKDYIRAVTSGYDILLEYSEEQRCFHFNYIGRDGRLYDGPSPYYMPIGFTDCWTYDGFRRTVTMTETLDEMISKYKAYYGGLQDADV